MKKILLISLFLFFTIGVQAQPGGGTAFRFRKLATADRPTCSASTEGYIYQDLTNHKSYRCDGTAWTDAFGSATNPTGLAATGINANSVGAETTITGLPAKYIIRKISFYGTSAGLTIAAFDVRTAASGGGTALVSGYVLSALTGSTKYTDATLASAALTDVQTASSLFVRNTIAQGSAATVSVVIEIQPIP